MLDGTQIHTPRRRPAGDLSILAGTRARPTPPYLIQVVDTAEALFAYHALRQREFVERQGLFARTDRDDIDDDPRTVVLAAIRSTCLLLLMLTLGGRGTVQGQHNRA